MGAMKSATSPTPPGPMNRVTRMAVSDRYSCRTDMPSPSGASAAMRQWPPRSLSRSEAKTLGESKRGVHHQSTVPADDTRAAVWRSPTIPCSAMGGYRSMRSPLRAHGRVVPPDHAQGPDDEAGHRDHHDRPDRVVRQ